MNSKDIFWRLSRFTHFVDGKDNYVAVFNALNLGMVIVNSNTADLLKSKNILRENELSSEIVEKLKKQRILISSSDSESEDLYLVQRHLDGHTAIKILYLLLTDACNLRCGYCYFEGVMPKEYKFSKMTEKTAKQGIDIFTKLIPQDIQDAKDGVNDYQIIFYGGEPFYNWDVMKWALGYIRDLLDEGKLPKNISISINTNGTLITEEIANSLSQFPFINVAVSIDGPEHIHDLQRTDFSGCGSFSRVDQAIRMFQRVGVKFGFSCTLANHNIDQAEEILIWLHDTYSVSSIGFNILIGTSLLGLENSQEYSEKIADKLISCFLIAREKGIYEDRIMRKVRSFVNGNIYFYDCGGCGQQIVISPDGKVGVCQAYCGTKKYFTPFTKRFNPKDHPYWKEWKMRSPLNMSQCFGCIALGNCGGGCPYSADVKNGSIWSLDETFCIFSRKALTFLIKDLMKQTLQKEKRC